MSSFNGSGVFSISGTGLPYVPNTTISSTVANTLNSNLATGLSTTICRDGQSTVTANIPFAGFKLTGIGNGTAATDAAAFGQIASQSGLFVGFLGGLGLSTAGSSGTFGITSGAAVNSTATTFMSLASAFTKTTAAWVVGTGNGSLDASSIANNTWYHVFLIQGAGLAGDVLISTSVSAPTLPTGYTTFRRIGSLFTNGSAQWIKFIQRGNVFTYDSPQSDVTGQSITSTPALFALSVPPGVSVTANTRMAMSTGANGRILVQSPDEASASALGTAGNASAAWLTTSSMAYQLATITNTAQQVRIAAESGSSVTLTLVTYGWVDARGQG